MDDTASTYEQQPGSRCPCLIAGHYLACIHGPGNDLRSR